ncbi:MAG: hypothetical protein KF760_29170 [Candidatus Eremiobacteraeota bacterium]|nr:hypothetical protein [Candidatus Eremiobacteraeota bacterium]MCW5865955.1 hypothetical protein [Candidatus Eremiobacteraeota bacterium]
MQIHSFPRINQPQIKTQLPFHFNNEENNNNDQDWGMNPNPDNYRPNWALVGSGVAGGVAGGAALGMLAGNALSISPVPFMLAGALTGAYVGLNIGLALSCKQ